MKPEVKSADAVLPFIFRCGINVQAKINITRLWGVLQKGGLFGYFFASVTYQII